MAAVNAGRLWTSEGYALACAHRQAEAFTALESAAELLASELDRGSPHLSDLDAGIRETSVLRRLSNLLATQLELIMLEEPFEAAKIALSTRSARRRARSRWSTTTRHRRPGAGPPTLGFRRCSDA